MRTSRRELVFVAAILLVALALRCTQLDIPSYTWDELTDREIAYSYLMRGDLTEADREPSQARLPIYLEALVIKLWNGSETALRSISVVAGLLSLCLIWRVGRRVFGPPVGLVALGVAAFNPFHLLISRLSGTHGDALLALFYALGLWILLDFWDGWRERSFATFARRERWRLLLFGLVAGVATGAKLTGVLLLANLLPVLIVGRRNWRQVLPWLLASGVLWLGFFLLSSPIYLHPENLLAAWQDQATHWEQIRGYQFMGRVYETLPLWYWGVVIPIKFTIPVALAVLFQVIWLLVRWRRVGPLPRVLLFNLFPLLIFMARRWQSPTYAAILIVPLFTLVARSLVQLGQVAVRFWRQGGLRRAVGALAALGIFLVPAESARVIATTHPDYLMTGYDFGDAVIGEFWGPAVFHCQGAGQALAYLSTQPPGDILAPESCVLPVAYYRIVHDLPEVTFESELEDPANVLAYRYVVLPYSVTYMTAPYPHRQETQVLRQGLDRYCTVIYAYGLPGRDLFWVYRCDRS
jgi:4-amino-4-deoxy-L-arabinose transferase-like glycosyltransferase